MFKYSLDEFIAAQQKERALMLLEDILKEYYVIQFLELEKIFDQYVKNYDFIEELHNIALLQNQRIVMPIIPRTSAYHNAAADLQRGYNKFNKSKLDPIPYIEFSFPEEHEPKHGYEFKHVYIFFLTQLDFKESCDCIIHYITKLNNLKAFL